MSLAEEKKLIKEMEQLKQSKKTAAQYVTHEEVRPWTENQERLCFYTRTPPHLFGRVSTI